MPGTPGTRVVLTADRGLMAAYSVLLDGMVASSQTTTTPWPVMDRLLLPRAAHPEGRALFAPAGLRRRRLDDHLGRRDGVELPGDLARRRLGQAHRDHERADAEHRADDRQLTTATHR